MDGIAEPVRPRKACLRQSHPRRIPARRKCPLGKIVKGWKASRSTYDTASERKSSATRLTSRVFALSHITAALARDLDIALACNTSEECGRATGRRAITSLPTGATGTNVRTETNGIRRDSRPGAGKVRLAYRTTGNSEKMKVTCAEKKV